MGEVVDGLIEIKPQDIKRIAEGPEKPMYSWGLRGRGAERTGKRRLMEFAKKVEREGRRK